MSRTMHAQSHPLTIVGTVLNESDALDTLGLTFDSKITFKKHLRSVSSAASQRVGILRKPCRVFHDRSALGRCFPGFVLPVLECCSAVWCSAADTHAPLTTGRCSRWCQFFNWGVFECDISHHQSVAV